MTFDPNLLVLAERDMPLVFFTLLLQLFILILDRGHDGLDSRGKHGQNWHFLCASGETYPLAPRPCGGYTT
jgi:hypothetical protein